LGEPDVRAGRCGDTHNPPNSRHDYDYENSAPVASDCEDWKPQGGAQTQISAARWRDIPYSWPNGVAPEDGARVEAQYYIYWRQNMPGRENLIQDATGEYMTNWWQFVGDWDGSVSQNLGLHAATPAGN
jgi:hypothetical protein